MIAAATLLYAVLFVVGSAMVKLAPTWASERTGWMLVFLSSGFLMSLAARA